MLTSIIIPTLNEAENIDPLLRRDLNVIEENGLDEDVFVADGGSTDGTAEMAAEWAPTRPVKFIRSEGTRGLSGDVLHAAGCILLQGTLMFFIVAGMPGLGPFCGMPVPVPWKETSHAIDSIDVHTDAVEKWPLVIGLDDDYWIPSEYSFYIGSDSKFEPAGRHLVDKRAVMWAYWLPTEEAAGRDAVLISSKAERLNDTRLQSYFEQMEEVVELPVLKNGRLTGQFFYRFAGSYRLSP